jgi:hypothetical protein
VLGGGSPLHFVVVDADELAALTSCVVVDIAKGDHVADSSAVSPALGEETAATAAGAGAGAAGASLRFDSISAPAVAAAVHKMASTPGDASATGDALDGHEHKFLATVECKRLARWLRVVGVNVSTPKEQDHDKIFAMARNEGRLILTCNKAMAKRRNAVACYLLEAHDVETQFQVGLIFFF